MAARLWPTFLQKLATVINWVWVSRRTNRLGWYPLINSLKWRLLLKLEAPRTFHDKTEKSLKMFIIRIKYIKRPTLISSDSLHIHLSVVPHKIHAFSHCCLLTWAPWLLNMLSIKNENTKLHWLVATVLYRVIRSQYICFYHCWKYPSKLFLEHALSTFNGPWWRRSFIIRTCRKLHPNI